jgi:hypothetical protein
MASQDRMFDHEDLPLFSGTAPKGQDEVYEPELQSRQGRLPGMECPICHGFGAVRQDGKLKRCICQVRVV